MDTGLGFTGGAPLDVSATCGAQLASFFYLGAGVNFCQWGVIKPEVESLSQLNVIINPRFEIPTGSIVKPYIDFKGGYGIAGDGRLFWSPTLGVKVSRFMFGLGYLSQDFTTEYGRYYYYHSTGESVMLRFGVTF